MGALPVAGALALSALTVSAGHGQNFRFVEETTPRLPPDSELAGTSTTDVDLVDVDRMVISSCSSAKAPTAPRRGPTGCWSTTVPGSSPT